MSRSRAKTLTVLGHVELAASNLERAVQSLFAASDIFFEINKLLCLPWSLECLVEGLAVHDHWTAVATSPEPVLARARRTLWDRISLRERSSGE